MSMKEKLHTPNEHNERCHELTQRNLSNRRDYIPPVLVELGDVRGHTLGGSQFAGDSGGLQNL